MSASSQPPGFQSGRRGPGLRPAEGSAEATYSAGTASLAFLEAGDKNSGVTAAGLQRRLTAQLVATGVTAPDDVVAACVEYLVLLGRWNRRINLTAFDLESPSEAALNRLILEPLAAARFVLRDDLTAVDIGSGSGSPALPLALMTRALSWTLFEAREKKSAFLREAARVLGLRNVTVETARVGDDVIPEPLRGAVTLVTVRAVRLDGAVWRGIEAIARPDCRLLVFGNSVIQQNTHLAGGWVPSAEVLWQEGPRLSFLQKTGDRNQP